MGLYDTYGTVQLKVRECDGMQCYRVGDKADLPDGLYAGYGGIVVIVKGKFVAEFPHLFDKWGGQLDVDFEAHNPIVAVVESFSPFGEK